MGKNYKEDKMPCEYCLKEDGHTYRCPNYIPQKTRYNCAICNEGIQNGEEYIVNDNDDYAHFECVDYARDLARFLNYDIKEMNSENY